MTDGLFCITVQDLKALQDKKVPCQVLDVREESERQICVLANDHHIPLSDLSTRYHELDPHNLLVVYCRSGVRSSQAVRFLEANGFENVKNLEGGILQWAKEIDLTMNTY